MYCRKGVNKMHKRSGVLFSLAVFLVLFGFESPDIIYDNCKEPLHDADCSQFIAEGAGSAKNVILMIGDGMGINQVVAARIYENGPKKPLELETPQHQGTLSTCSLSGITDSAAAGTALATGHKTLNSRISTGPNGETLKSMLEEVKAKRATGLVTTCQIYDATPAVFAAHTPDRSESRKIIQDFLKTRPELLMGGGLSAWSAKADAPDLVKDARKAGYTYVQTRTELLSLDLDRVDRLLGLFAETDMTYEAVREQDNPEPHLHEMTVVALDLLSRDPRGFFLMVEGGTLDHACHRMSLNRMLAEVLEFNESVKVVLEWAESHPQTLVIITADHETGGLEIMSGHYSKGDRVKVKWTTAVLPMVSTHSSQRVPIYAQGPNSAAIKDYQDNTAVYCIIHNAFK
jgi:alkaline phosphatase